MERAFRSRAEAGVKNALAAAVMLLLAVFLAACQEESTGPTVQDFNKNRAELEKRVAAAKARGEKKKKRKAAQASAPAADRGEPAFAAVGSFDYDELGKRDPFRSFEWDRLARESQLVRGPLEQFDVSQLHLVAVVWKTGRARALIEDPSGQTYIVSAGTKIGKNEGKVLSISDNSLIVKETYVDLLGQKTTKDIELSIRRVQGG